MFNNLSMVQRLKIGNNLPYVTACQIQEVDTVKQSLFREPAGSNTMKCRDVEIDQHTKQLDDLAVHLTDLLGVKTTITVDTFTYIVDDHHSTQLLQNINIYTDKPLSGKQQDLLIGRIQSIYKNLDDPVIKFYPTEIFK